MPKRPTTTQRGYGRSHQQLRNRLAVTVKAGEAICWRCGRPIHPGQEWDLGHDDHDRSIYRGAEHRRAADCPMGGNRATKRHNRQHPTQPRTGQLYIITGPPAAGKSTWVQQHAKPGDITIDYDAIACTLSKPGADPHDHPDHVKALTKVARKAAIDHALTLGGSHTTYIIHSTPSQQLLDHYRSHGAEIITIDPGQDVVMARCKAERPWRITQAAKQWYNGDRRNDNDSTAAREFFK